MESQAIQAEISTSDDAQFDRKRGLTNDLMVYWKIYSKMGIGGRLSGLNRQVPGTPGDVRRLLLSGRREGRPLPAEPAPGADERAGSTRRPEVASEVLDRVAWPTPFWAHGGWPVSCSTSTVPNCPWPMPHLRAGIGELKFLNWAMSFLAGKIRNTSRDFIAVAKEAGEEIKAAILEGRDETILELEADHKTVAELSSSSSTRR
jgi:hypothetical protein